MLVESLGLLLGLVVSTGSPTQLGCADVEPPPGCPVDIGNESRLPRLQQLDREARAAIADNQLGNAAEHFRCLVVLDPRFENAINAALVMVEVGQAAQARAAVECARATAVTPEQKQRADALLSRLPAEATPASALPLKAVTLSSPPETFAPSLVVRPEATSERERSFPVLRTAGIGVTSVSLLTGAVLYGLARSSAADFRESQSREGHSTHSRLLRDEALDYQTASIVAAVTGAVLAVVTGLVWDR